MIIFNDNYFNFCIYLCVDNQNEKSKQIEVEESSEALATKLGNLHQKVQSVAEGNECI